jgi:CDP-6-deoxy-D-xylo-4-hexulose-3-dehydrase
MSASLQDRTSLFPVGLIVELAGENGLAQPAVVLDCLDAELTLLVALIEPISLPADDSTSLVVLNEQDLQATALPGPCAVHTQKTRVTSHHHVTDTGHVLAPATMGRIFRRRIEIDTRRFTHSVHVRRPFSPGDPVNYGGRVFDELEVQAGINSVLDFWLTLGPEGNHLQHELARYLGVRFSILVNSGSSANLLAMAALTSPRLGERRLRPGDEVITVAAGFPTTVNPIIQCGCVPVFIDADPLTGNARVEQLEDARTDRTHAVMMAHTLGNPFDLEAVAAFCRQYNLWLIEDNCDALGSLYRGKLTGTFGDLSTQSFYPPHHITMGEGGAVNVIREARLKLIVESLRDWGRDCWCDPGKDNTCNKRFKWQLGNLPAGYDHKYIYSHLGYSMKPLDIQAAIGREQLKKLPDFVAARNHNWQRLARGFEPFEEFFELPRATPGAEPSWFGFMSLVRPGAPFTRRELIDFFELRHIQTRMLFGGNLTRQPAYLDLEPVNGRPPFRVIGDLAGADRIMNNAVFLGVYPGLTDAHIDYMIETLADFLEAHGAL